MNKFIVLLCITLWAAYTDHQHYSQVFEENRNFRVFTPLNYDSASATTYPVIYYCNGCGGSYQGDQYSSYYEGGESHPYNCWGADCDPVMNKPFNPDFAMYTDSNEVIVVLVDGKLYNFGGCDVYYPYRYISTWTGNDYDYTAYFGELIDVVDSLYNTKPDRQYRAITGLSMGGHAALWMSATNPHLIRSASSFCHSPSYHVAGPPPNTTPVDVTQLWRNYRGISKRTSANDQDYLYQYSQQIGIILEGAGFENEYHEAVFWRHWAADIDSQFDFHMKTFSEQKADPACFSFINLYPDFDIWDYHVQSSKAEEGWIYLRDVTQNSMGVYTRYRLPYGKPLTPFTMNITTPDIYNPNASYTLVKYDYRQDTCTAASIQADSLGRLQIQSDGCMGEEFGISGNGLDPAVAVLTDTVCETIYLREGSDSVFTLDAVNLTENGLSPVIFYVSSENEHIKVVSGMKIADMPAKSRVALDSLVTLRGTYVEHHNIGYVKITIYVNGSKIAKEQFIQVHVTDSAPVRGLYRLDEYRRAGQHHGPECHAADDRLSQS
jgi:hypothetical protein